MTIPAQPGILEPVPAVARYVLFSAAEGADRARLAAAPQHLAEVTDGKAVAFGKSHAAFEAQMRRMAGEEDGVTDALFRVSRPVTGACLWCPPIVGGRLGVRQLGL